MSIKYVAGGVGIGIGILGFLIEDYLRHKDRQKHVQELEAFQKVISQLQNEVAQLKEAVAGGSGDHRKNRNKTRTRRGYSGYDSESTVYTDDDDEFFDLSSDENDIEPVESLFNEVDLLMKSSSTECHKQALKLLLERLSQHEKNPNYLWRLAKAYRLDAVAAKERDDKETQEHAIGEGLKYANEAVRLDETNPDSHKWLAIILGMRSDFLPIKDKVPNGALFYKHVERAIELRPTDHTLHYLLARFKFEVADLSWIEKRAAAMFGELPNATIEDAINEAERAKELSPEAFPDNDLLIAKCYIASGDTDKAKMCLDQAKSAILSNNVDVSLKKEIESLFQKYCKI